MSWPVLTNVLRAFVGCLFCYIHESSARKHLKGGIWIQWYYLLMIEKAFVKWTYEAVDSMVLPVDGKNPYEKDIRGGKRLSRSGQ